MMNLKKIYLKCQVLLKLLMFLQIGRNFEALNFEA